MDNIPILVSAYHAFAACNSKGLAEQKKPDLVEDYGEACIIGRETLFQHEHPEIISLSGPSKGTPKSDFREITVAAEAFRSGLADDSVWRAPQGNILAGTGLESRFLIKGIPAGDAHILRRWVSTIEVQNIAGTRGISLLERFAPEALTVRAAFNDGREVEVVVISKTLGKYLVLHYPSSEDNIAQGKCYIEDLTTWFAGVGISCGVCDACMRQGVHNRDIEYCG